ncbi:ParA family protein [Bacteriovorax sp. DB6_IX]|uniref:ParA family protein n=1 Tax=Bacteriovorax sp. DB6_IX TaxID=1353530 RepID=UPI00038A061E|nr:AAA family ATPase [Bacteriovorax sp. DB6_IX]EQC52539.1 CobQ/CobB/MinD/ParA nucleotide binding domain protein [Bacteriovorax sp. DB6_IX]
MDTYLPLKKVAEIFGDKSLQSQITKLEEAGEIPPSRKYRSGALYRKGWSRNILPQIGEKVGYFKKFERSVALSVFTTKGGVLKSTLALNLARTAALHGMKTCVIGLDIQGDVTTALGHDCDLDSNGDLEEIIERLDQTKGLTDFFAGHVSLDEIITQVGLPNLFVIPETPELVALNDSLSNINRREFWLREKVVNPLKEYFDLIIMDCSPNWNKLTTNALVACDALISPLECKINNFRNFKVFGHFLKEFKDEMGLDFESIFVPTKYSQNRKLSNDILTWYQGNVEGCTSIGIRESVLAEEAMALNLSIVEHASAKPIANELMTLMREVHGRIEDYLERHQGLDSQTTRVLGASRIGNIEGRF